MPATLLELFDGRTEAIAGRLAATIPYAIIGAADEADARATALASIPTTFNGIPRSGITISERVNATTWKAIASYEQPDSGGGSDTATLENTYTFETGGGQQNVKQGYSGFSKRYSADDPGTGTVVDSVINFDKDSVNGVDIVIPQFQWSETYWFSPAVVTEGYKALVASCSGNINDRAFRGYAAGEVLFLGASGTKQGNGWWQITFKFARERNRINIPIGFSGLTVASKLGWQYLWIRYEDGYTGSGPAKHAIKTPVAAYVEDVYQATDLAGNLGI
jgi:hypothetical protein